MRTFLSIGFGFVVLAACGGSVSTVPDGSSSGSTSGSSGASGSSGSSGGSSGSSGSFGAPGCTTAPLDGNLACVPGTAQANASITIDVGDTEGCLACFTTVEACKVTVTGKTIVVGMTAKTCTPPGDVACPAFCGIPSSKCTIPPLPAGTYTVQVTGEGNRTGVAPRELVVTADSKTTSCTLPQVGQPVEPLNPSKYSTSCSVDEDCRAITTGSICQPCVCPNAAIAKASGEQYEADLRARASQCPTTNDPIACAACRAPIVKCDDKVGLTGVCKLVP